MPRTLIAVFVGGMAGTALRLAADLALPSAGPLQPSTLLVNVLGSFLLGALTGLARRRPLPVWLHVGLATGLLGGFTTFRPSRSRARRR